MGQGAFLVYLLGGGTRVIGGVVINWVYSNVRLVRGKRNGDLGLEDLVSTLLGGVCSIYLTLYFGDYGLTS